MDIDIIHKHTFPTNGINEYDFEEDDPHEFDLPSSPLSDPPPPPAASPVR